MIETEIETRVEDTILWRIRSRKARRVAAIYRFTQISEGLSERFWTPGGAMYALNGLSSTPSVVGAYLVPPSPFGFTDCTRISGSKDVHRIRAGELSSREPRRNVLRRGEVCATSNS